MYLGIVLASVVLISGLFSYYQEAKSDRYLKIEIKPSFFILSGLTNFLFL